MENYELQSEIITLKEIIIRLEKQITQEKSSRDYLEKTNRELKKQIEELKTEKDAEV